MLVEIFLNRKHLWEKLPDTKYIFKNGVTVAMEEIESDKGMKKICKNLFKDNIWYYAIYFLIEAVEKVSCDINAK